jgi:hypothetical protein
MAASAAQISQVRLMCGLAAGDTTYTDAILTTYIETYPVLDAFGLQWYVWDYTTYPPHQDVNDDWVPSYDLNAAAGDVWSEKAGSLAAKFDFSADGANMSLSQQYQQAQQQARYYRARRAAGTIKHQVEPRPQDTSLYGSEDL